MLNKVSWVKSLQKLKIFLIVTNEATDIATKSYRVFISKNDNNFINLDSVRQQTLI